MAAGSFPLSQNGSGRIADPPPSSHALHNTAAPPHASNRIATDLPVSPSPATSQVYDNQTVQPAGWPSELSLSSLPPLPPGLEVDHLVQFGSVGLEMAIRMGMGIGMGLGQQAQQQQVQTQNQPVWTRNLVSTPSSHHTSSPETSIPQSGSRKQNVVRDILNDDFLVGRAPTTPITTPPARSAGGVASFPTSRRPSGDVIAHNMQEASSPEEMAKNDPLATQIWKAYARGRKILPNGQRMENLTWRMMHLTLKKQEEMATVKEEPKSSSSTPVDGEQRGRSKGKSRVVGFQKDDSPQPE
jgi:GATA-binding protein